MKTGQSAYFLIVAIVSEFVSKPRACVLEHGLGIFRLASKTAFYICVPAESQGLTEIARAFEVTCRLLRPMCNLHVFLLSDRIFEQYVSF